MANYIKIVQRYYSKNEIARGVSFYKNKAKKDGRVVTCIEYFDACTFFRKNGWLKNNPFKNLALPKDGDYIIVVHFSTNAMPERTVLTIERVKKGKMMSKKFFPVRLDIEQRSVTFFNVCYSHLSTLIIARSLRYIPSSYPGNSKVIQFSQPSSIAA